MNAELLIELERLEQQSCRNKENNRRTEDEIRKLREKTYLQKRDTEKSELSKDRKLSREPQKHPYQWLTREQSPVRKYTLAALYGHEERHQNQGSIDKDTTTVKVHASKHSNFLFNINDSLGIMWDKLNW